MRVAILIGLGLSPAAMNLLVSIQTFLARKL